MLLGSASTAVTSVTEKTQTVLSRVRKDAVRARRRFYVAFDFKGLDSHGTTGLAANSKGAVYEVVTEQLTGGWGGYVSNDGRVHTPTVLLCKNAPIEQTTYRANRYLTCPAESSSE